MKKIIVVIALMIQHSFATAAIYYSTALCAYPEYQCIKVGAGQTWENLFPNEQQRDIVQKLNRTYNNLWAGKVLVMPKNIAQKTILDYSPFPLTIQPEGEKQVIVDQDKLAWGAYDADGKLVKWGPISSGTDRCSDNYSRSCRTMTGIFRFFSKENEKCRSNVYPIGKGGAKMPFCMYFHKGFALHGSPDIPGHRASHGCVRMFTRDAEWLNHNFIDLSNEGNAFKGTKVVVRPVLTKESAQ